MQGIHTECTRFAVGVAHIRLPSTLTSIRDQCCDPGLLQVLRMLFCPYEAAPERMSIPEEVRVGVFSTGPRVYDGRLRRCCSSCSDGLLEEGQSRESGRRG